jgi:hypothetical protein
MFVPTELRLAMAPGEEVFAGLVPGYDGPEKRYQDDPNGAGSRDGPEEPLHSDEPNHDGDSPLDINVAHLLSSPAR